MKLILSITLLFLFSFSSAWALPECEGSPANIETTKDFDSLVLYWDKCEGTVVLLGDTIFSGNWNNGFINGEGTITYNAYTKKASRYEGNIKKGFKDGFGKYFLRNGRVKVGEWNEGKFVKGKTYNNGEYDYYYDYRKDKVFSKLKSNNEGQILNNKEEVDPVEETSSEKLDMTEAKATCLDIGFKEGTEKFGECVLELTK